MRAWSRLPSLSRRRALPCFAASALLLAGCGAPSAQPIEHVEVQWGERPVDGAWKEVTTFAALEPAGDSDAIWIRAPVPASTVSDPALRLHGHLLTRLDAMWIGETRVAMTETTRVVALPRASSEVIFHGRPEPGATVPEIAFGSQHAIWTTGLRSEIPELAVCGVLLLAGLLLLGSTLRRGASPAYRGLGLFLAALGAQSFTLLPLLRAVVLPSSRALLMTNEIASTLHPVGFAVFVSAIFGDVRWKLIGRGVRVFAIAAVIAWGLFFVGLPTLDALHFAANLSVVFFLGLGMALAGKRARAGDRAARAYLYGIAALMVIALPDILDGMGTNFLPFQTVPYALLAFGAAMSVVIERRLGDTKDALAASAGELSRKVADLQERNVEVQALNVELRHQIAERSKELAGALRAGITAPSLGLSLREGDVVDGRYRVVGALGSGGMGTVHEVERLKDGRRFALKVMSGHPHPTTAARFAREAEIAARIADPHLVSVVDVSGSTSAGMYLVMELVHGRSLEEMRDRFGDVAWGVPVLAQIASGLAVLHAAGVVHRDLKPGNVLLARAADGLEIAKISDFGISRFDAVEDDDAGEDEAGRGAKEEPQPETLDRPVALWAAETEARQEPVAVSARTPPAVPLTGTGVVMGTPAYMAPEIRRGARFAKPASDLFAFGLIAYEILAGRAAFSAPPIHLAFTMKRLPAVEPLPPEVPAELGALVLSCLAEAPSLRPAASEAASVLARATGKSVA